ncbi:hypothetical protein HSX11_19630 [Oxalobacteraceae bacterium]|nr:hypothetical protein [Oxalobacteraceae bacterium]
MNIRTRSRFTRALGALLAAWSLQAGAFPFLRIEPTSSLVLPGQSFSADVTIRDVGDLFAYQFDLVFNPALLQATAVDEGSFLLRGGPTIFFPGTIDNRSGRVSFTLASLTDDLAGVSGSGDLFRVSFQARDNAGRAAMAVSNVMMLDSQLGDIFFDDAGSQVNVVPEPGMLELLAPMVLAMGWALRRKRRG